MARGNEAQLIAAYIAGLTLDQIAATAGVSRSTVQRRLRDPAFRERIAHEKDTAIGITVQQLAAQRSVAVAKLGQLMDSDNEATVLRAATALLRMSAHFEDQYSMAQKLSALEQAAAEFAREAGQRDSE